MSSGPKGAPRDTRDTLDLRGRCPPSPEPTREGKVLSLAWPGPHLRSLYPPLNRLRFRVFLGRSLREKGVGGCRREEGDPRYSKDS